MNISSRSIPHRGASTASRGFTLIEIMIVVLIVGILAAIALTSYQRQVVESRRKAATACLMESAQFMERFYTTNLRYDETTAGNAVALPAVSCFGDLAEFYTFTIGAVDQRTFRIDAAPQGVQASRDGLCGTLALEQDGRRTVSGTGTAAQCW
jgi:type IV pilus assembly protein PilE